jgi:hypothetical protein
VADIVKDGEDGEDGDVFTKKERLMILASSLDIGFYEWFRDE